MSAVQRSAVFVCLQVDNCAGLWQCLCDNALLAIMKLTSGISELIIETELLKIPYESVFVANVLLIFYSISIPDSGKLILAIS